MLKHCGFLPSITHSYNSQSSKIEHIGWIYQFTTNCSFRLNSSNGIESFKSIKSFDEFERFHILLEKKPYLNDFTNCEDLYHAFFKFFQEKARLQNLNTKIDTLLDTDMCNPELLLEVDEKEAIR